jgi:hypothetical protein
MATPSTNRRTAGTPMRVAMESSASTKETPDAVSWQARRHSWAEYKNVKLEANPNWKMKGSA